MPPSGRRSRFVYPDGVVGDTPEAPLLSVARVEPKPRPLRMFGAPSGSGTLGWEWVEDALVRADTYWVVARGVGHPHPRPVWGVWHQRSLHLSLGSPAINAAVAADPTVTVHLDSGLDVVIVEGLVVPPRPATPGPVEVYDAKYDWHYDVDRYGELVQVDPSDVLAWRTAGPAGRDGFGDTGRWSFAG